jgi:putative ABC transport system substrate-binding protein
MGELGYTEGRNIKIEDREIAGKSERLSLLIREIKKLNADVIVALNSRAAREALDGTDSTVVFLAADPVGSGLVSQLSRPDSRATGVSIVGTELTTKRLELLGLLVPKARRFAFLGDTGAAPGKQQFEAAMKAAGALGLQIFSHEVKSSHNLDQRLLALGRSNVQGVIISSDALLYGKQPQVARALRALKLAAVFPVKQSEPVLISYGPSPKRIARKVAEYVDRILKGARPADLPVEQISEYELVVNLRIAEELGIKLPAVILQRADEVIR